MRRFTTRQRRCGGLTALLFCAFPFVALCQDLGRETLSPPDAAALSLPARPLTDAEFDFNQDNSQELIVMEPGPTPTVAAEVAYPFGYNLRQSNTSWLVGDGDDFGMFSLESLPSLSPGKGWGIVSGVGFHFLGGPIQTDMPPRLFDFQIGLQGRKWISDTFGYDVAARVGAFSDFEGSAREGVRFPGHAVGYYRWQPAMDLVFGIEVLDRDDISLLPVAGVILTPRDDLRLELVFPRPRLEVRLNPTHSIYLAGELGGGTWAVERIDDTDDVATYRDLRLLLGLSSRDEEGTYSNLEIGYVFERDLSYRSGTADFRPDDTLLIRVTNTY